MQSSAGSFDSMRTLRMGVYGLLLLGPSQHFWFNFLSKYLPKRDMLTTLKKILMGQALFGPPSTSVFFSYNAVLQGKKHFKGKQIFIMNINIRTFYNYHYVPLRTTFVLLLPFILLVLFVVFIILSIYSSILDSYL